MGVSDCDIELIAERVIQKIEERHQIYMLANAIAKVLSDEEKERLRKLSDEATEAHELNTTATCPPEKTTPPRGQP